MILNRFITGTTFTLAMLVTLLFVPPAFSAAPAETFVTEMGNKAFASLSEKGLSSNERKTRFHALLRNVFDMPQIARFTLGRYWRIASNEEKTEFTELFERFFVQAYSNRFRDLSGKKFLVTQSRKISTSQSLVLSEIIIPGKPSIKVNWRVRSKGINYKVIDVVVEGISMSVTQRDEFVSVIRQTGGRISGLLRALRRKTK
ncbi:MAG: ABC transporter substrate-binding protein [Pseudomonadota bacterium]|nr:ABC transporter substrate-binding protein [Pseudomonadota bacterium]